MKRTHWISVAIVVGGIAGFLGFDGPLRVSNGLHRKKSASARSLPDDQWVADPAISRVAAKIVALTVDRSGCFGTCPVYVLRLERNGNALYDGKEFVARLGRYTGKHYGFEWLAYFAAAHLLSLKDDYHRLVTDNATTVLTIEMTDGTKHISDYADAGPNELLIFCTALDGVASSVEWVPEKIANQSPDPTPPSGAGHL